MTKKLLVSIIVPVFNEELNIKPFYEAVNIAIAGLLEIYDFEFVFTDNHSTDATFSLIRELAHHDSRVFAYRFSRNFGYQRSILTGYTRCKGDAAVQLDVDLQDPPELLTRVIVEKILDLINDYLPSPLDVGATQATNPKTGDVVERQPSDEAPLSALAFKIATDPFVGRLIFVRVYSGKLTAGSYVLNTTTGDKERIGRVVRMHADKREDIDMIGAGDIAAVVGLKGTFTGHTLSDPANPVLLESIEFPEPPVSIAVEPKTKADQEKNGYCTATPC